jgi:hypothetical protein
LYEIGLSAGLFLTYSNFKTFALGLLFLISEVSYSQPIPFIQKFERQQSTSYRGGPVWRSGEQISAPMSSSCKGLLTLQVAENVPGGVVDVQHADIFNVVSGVYPSLKQTLSDWRGFTFEGIVEIIEPIVKKNQIANIQNYNVRIVSVSPPTSPINPSLQDLLSIPSRAEVIIVGKVAAIDEKLLVIKTPKATYQIQLRTGIPVIDGDLSDRIRNLSGNERITVGDSVQIKTYKINNSDLGARECGCCHLDYPSPGRLTQYMAERRSASLFISLLKEAVQSQDWPLFRTVHANFVKLQLTATEIERYKISLID